MNNNSNFKESDTRRVFVNKNTDFYQLFSFNQHKDGSIYCSFPNFTNARWIQYKQTDNGPLIEKLSLTDEGKLSIHGTGRSSIRPHNNPKAHDGIIWGNYLLNNDKKQISARHLFSAYIEEPLYLPPSKAFNRLSDYSLNTPTLKPFVIVFFAFPRSGLKLSLKVSLHIDLLDNIPPEGGFGTFPLIYHDIFWYIYRAKNMDIWPSYTHICYFDGYSVPLFFPQTDNKMYVEYRNPLYKIDSNVLSVEF